MTDIERFIKARIEEDEAGAPGVVLTRRDLAEAKAKRELLVLYQIAGTIRPPDMGWHLLKSALYATATVYAAHPDYKESWRV